MQRKARQTFDDFEEDYDIPGSCVLGYKCCKSATERSLKLTKLF